VDLQPLVHTHKGLSISLRNLSSNHGREREREERKNPSFFSSKSKNGEEVRRKKGKALPYP
jgi:hypothetical protein